MSTLTIRNIEPQVKDRLRVSAALNHRSMEEEVRCILRQIMIKPVTTLGLGTQLNARFAAMGGVGLDLPPKQNVPKAAVFEDVSLIP